MKFTGKLFFYLLFSMLVSCVGQEEEEVVELKDNSFLNEATVSVENGKFQGEFSISEEFTHIFKVYIQNNTNGNMIDIGINFVDPDVRPFTFYQGPPPEGVGDEEQPEVGYPGFDGTCGAFIAPGERCFVNLQFATRVSGLYEQQIQVSYTDRIKKRVTTHDVSAVAGTAASLIAVDDVTLYDYGVRERSERDITTQLVTIRNAGELTARNINFQTLSDNDPNAFQIVENNCGDTLVAGESCDFTVNYSSLNFRDNDVREANYSSQFLISYLNDPLDNSANLSFFFRVLSTTIEANFESILSSISFTPRMTVGNSEQRNIKFKNVGYREGYPFYFEVFDNNGDFLARCHPNETEDEELLQCKNLAGDLLTLPQFPFRIYDDNLCIGRLVAGPIGETPGETCNFRVIFQPSVEYLTDMSFTNLDFQLRYDTRWKNQEYIVQNSLYDITATSKPAARMVITRLRFNGNPIRRNEDGRYDLGRVALVTSSAYGNNISITLRNRGGDRATFTRIFDGKDPANEIEPNGAPVNLNSYYRNASSNCFSLGAGQSCSIDFFLSPLEQSTTAEQNQLMYDDIANKIKYFSANYLDGTTIEDDGSSRTEREVGTSLTALLIAKGFMSLISDSSTGIISGTLQSGNRDFRQFQLENTGTGPIPYVGLIPGNTLTREETDTQFPYSFVQAGVDGAPGVPTGQKDCFTIGYLDGQIPDNPDPARVLDKGESCYLTVKYEIEETDRVINGSIPIFLTEWNNTLNLWEYNSFSPSFNELIGFEYYDGDVSDPIVSNPPQPNTRDRYKENFGKRIELPNFGQVRASFQRKANLLVCRPAPVLNAFIYRPGLDIPPVPNGPSVTNNRLNPRFFFSEGTNNNTASNRAREAVPHFNANNYGATSPEEFTAHFGTYPLGSGIHNMNFSLRNYGRTTARLEGFQTDGSLPELTLNTNFSLPRFIGLNSAVGFSFSLDTDALGPGVYTEAFDFLYFNGVETLNQRVHIIVEIALPLDPPTIEYELYDVTQDENGVITEGLSGQRVSYDFGVNRLGQGASVPVLSAIRGAEVYSKMRVHITNNTPAPISSLRGFITTAIGSPRPESGGGGQDFTFSNNTCNVATLGIGDSCFYDITYHPRITASPDLRLYPQINYEIQSNQFVSNVMALDFRSFPPAEVRVTNLITRAVDLDNGDSIEVYDINFGSFFASSGIRVNDRPTIANRDSINVTNASIVKASFLKMFDGETVPDGDPIILFSDETGSKKSTVWASRACLYGDDEFDAGVPDDEKGFNSETSAPCTLELVFEADEKYVADEIEEKDEFVELEFYNNKRSSFDSINLGVRGFVKPNPVSGGAGYFEVSSDSSGDVEFSWDVFTVPPGTEDRNTSWGPIVGYKVFQDRILSNLDNIYTIDEADFETGPNDRTATFSNLVAGRMYYFKVVAIREVFTQDELGNPVTKTYDVQPEDIIPLEVLVPPEGVVYDFDNGYLIDTEMLSGFYTKPEALQQCQISSFVISRNGVNVRLNKQLMNTTIVDYLLEDENRSDYPFIFVTHWLANPSTDIGPIFAPYDYDPAETQRYVPEANLLYKKDCSSTACDSLDQMFGGDGVDIPPGATLYIDGEEVEGAARCFAIL